MFGGKLARSLLSLIVDNEHFTGSSVSSLYSPGIIWVLDEHEYTKFMLSIFHLCRKFKVEIHGTKRIMAVVWISDLEQDVS